MIATNNGSFPLRGTDLGGELEETRRRVRAGQASREALRLLEDRASREAIATQARAGLGLVTDGLVRRADPINPIVSRLSGIRIGEERLPLPWNGADASIPIIEAEVAWPGPILVEDYLFASRGTPCAVKVVLTGPYTLARLAEDRAYGDPSSLAMALASALNQELRALQTAGAPFLQIDEPALLRRKEDFPVFTRIWEVLGRGVTTTLCLHLEGGAIDGLYPGVTRLKRLGCLSVDCVGGDGNLGLLRSAPWPDGLRLGLGMVDGRNETMESPEGIAATLSGVEGLPPRERILLGTASDLGGLPCAVASAKLEILGRAARLL